MKFQIYRHAPLLDGILDTHRAFLGSDHAAYRNHCMRVINFCCALSNSHGPAFDKISIAAAFHDLGIWTDDTLDYLGPSTRLARTYLTETRQGCWYGEIEDMIEQHHKLTRYKGDPEWLVEPFRKADWTDVSLGVLRFGMPAGFIKDVMKAFPNEGFHKSLLVLFKRRIQTDPLRPIPMMRI